MISSVDLRKFAAAKQAIKQLRLKLQLSRYKERALSAPRLAEAPEQAGKKVVRFDLKGSSSGFSTYNAYYKPRVDRHEQQNGGDDQSVMWEPVTEAKPCEDDNGIEIDLS